MGCCQSVEQFVVNENIDGQGVEVVEVAGMLCPVIQSTHYD